MIWLISSNLQLRTESDSEPLSRGQAASLRQRVQEERARLIQLVLETQGSEANR